MISPLEMEFLVSKTKAKPKRQEFVDQVLNGNCQCVLDDLPRDSVDTIVTSPPYFQQRHYSSKTEVGQEETPLAYTERLVEIFRGARQVLKDSGTLWLVLGDKYVNGAQLGMPWRVALALQDDGWILRSDIIWHKPNAMPSSTKTRLTTDHDWPHGIPAENWRPDQDGILGLWSSGDGAEQLIPATAHDPWWRNSSRGHQRHIQRWRCIFQWLKPDATQLFD